MRNTTKIFWVALIALVGLTQSCTGKNANAGKSGITAPSGTYGLSGFESWTITFEQGNFTMFVPAQITPEGVDTTATGSFSVEGNALTLSGLKDELKFTITNATTLTEPDGNVWKLIQEASAKTTLTVANNSDFPISVGVYNAGNITGGTVDNFLEIKLVNNGQSESFSLDAGSYGVFAARDAETVWMYPAGGSTPGLVAMNGEFNLRFTGTEIVK